MVDVDKNGRIIDNGDDKPYLNQVQDTSDARLEHIEAIQAKFGFGRIGNKKIVSYLAEQEAAQRKVGQYQAADKLYSDVTTLYMLKDRMPELAHRTLDDLLKNVEAFMNDNSEAYSAYLARLKAGRK